MKLYNARKHLARFLNSCWHRYLQHALHALSLLFPPIVLSSEVFFFFFFAAVAPIFCKWFTACQEVAMAHPGSSCLPLLTHQLGLSAVALFIFQPRQVCNEKLCFLIILPLVIWSRRKRQRSPVLHN